MSSLSGDEVLAEVREQGVDAQTGGGDKVGAEVLDLAAAGAEEQCADPRGGKPSASGMHRLCKCPGSWLLESQCPPSEESADAAEGTLLHAHMEHGTLPEDAEQAELIQWCRDEEHRMERVVWPEVDITGADVVREERMWADDGSFSGQADYLAVCDDRALVIDYKFGRGEVAAPEANAQLGALALLVWQRWPHVSEVYVSILQPRVSRKPQIVKYAADDLGVMEHYLRQSIELARRPGARLVPGALQCKYCRALAVCPAQMELARQVTAADFLAVKGWAMWDGPQKRRAYDVAKLAEKWAHAVLGKVEGDLAKHKEAVREHEADPEHVPHPGESPIPGLSLGKGRSSFTVTDAQKAFATLHRELDVSAEEFVSCCKVGITDLHKITHSKLKARGESRTIQDSRVLTLTMLAPYGETKTTKGSIEVTSN